MVAGVAARATLADLIEAVVTSTDGVPLFVEELGAPRRAGLEARKGAASHFLLDIGVYVHRDLND